MVRLVPGWPWYVCCCCKNLFIFDEHYDWKQILMILETSNVLVITHKLSNSEQGYRGTLWYPEKVPRVLKFLICCVHNTKDAAKGVENHRINSSEKIHFIFFSPKLVIKADIKLSFSQLLFYRMSVMARLGGSEVRNIFRRKKNRNEFNFYFSTIFIEF